MVFDRITEEKDPTKERGGDASTPHRREGAAHLAGQNLDGRQARATEEIEVAHLALAREACRSSRWKNQGDCITDEDVAALVERLVAEKLRLTGFREELADLETAFMTLTKGKLA